jgi:hypothetical protein
MGQVWRIRQYLWRYASSVARTYTRGMLPTTADRRASRIGAFPHSRLDASRRSLRHSDLSPALRHTELTDWELNPLAPPRPPQVVAQETLNSVIRLRQNGSISGPEADRLLHWAGTALLAAVLFATVEDALKRASGR